MIKIELALILNLLFQSDSIATIYKLANIIMVHFQQGIYTEIKIMILYTTKRIIFDVLQ